MVEVLHDKFTRDVSVSVEWNYDPNTQKEGRCDSCKCDLGMSHEDDYKGKPRGYWTNYCLVTVSVYGQSPDYFTFCVEDAGWRNISSFIEDLISE